MTRREKQIYDLIKAMPMIEQHELAKALNIARSSVAVHIANLQRKGYILGRGYLINGEEFALGIGASNIDICGISQDRAMIRNSNPVSYSYAVGGVTRNISENLAKMGKMVRLITVVGDDHNSKQIIDSLDAARIDHSHSVVLKNTAASTYTSLLDENGDMFVAMSDMSILQRLNMSYLNGKSQIIKGAKVIFCDSALPEKVIDGLTDQYASTIPMFVDPVSYSYAKRLRSYIGKFHTVKPNKLELEVLSGVAIDNEDDLERACDVLLDNGVRQVVVSLGNQGCFYMDDEGNKLKRTISEVEHMENATGGGDAFMAGLIYAHMNHMSVEEKLDFSLAAGKIAVSTSRTTHPKMSVELIKKTLDNEEIPSAEEEELLWS